MGCRKHYFRRPRLCRIDSLLVSTRLQGRLLAGQLVPRQPLAYNLAYHDIEAVAVVHLAIVVAENLFIQIPEQVERFNRNVGALQATFY